MKIVIEIPEKTNAHIRSDYGHGMKCLLNNDVEILCDAIYHCSPYEERPRGEWTFKNGKYRCSVCLEPCATFCMNEPRDNFCLYCGSDNRPRKRGLRAKMSLIDDAADKKPDFEYLKVGDTIYTQDDDKQGWTGREGE